MGCTWSATLTLQISSLIITLGKKEEGDSLTLVLDFSPTEELCWESFERKINKK